MEIYFFVFGIIMAAIVAAAVLLTIIAFSLAGQIQPDGAKSRVLLPGFTLFSIGLLRPVLKKMFKFSGRNPLIVDATGVVAHNQLFAKKFKSVPAEECLVLLPQCLRHSDCPARLDPHEGFDCKFCGLCAICKIKKISDKIRVVVVPGGTFSKRILEESKPKTVLGVACPMELFDGLLLTDSLSIPSMGVMLSRYGCVETQVPVDAVVKMLGGVAD